MIGYNVPVEIAAMGAARRFGPPFADPALQAAYLEEAQRLAESSAFITEATARDIVASVINSALAAGESAIPSIVAAVRAEVKGTASKGLLTGVVVGAFALSVWALVRSGSRA